MHALRSPPSTPPKPFSQKVSEHPSDAGSDGAGGSGRPRPSPDVRTAAGYVSKVRTYTGIETPASGAEVKEPMRATEGRAGRAAKYDEGGR